MNGRLLTLILTLYVMLVAGCGNMPHHVSGPVSSPRLQSLVPKKSGEIKPPGVPTSDDRFRLAPVVAKDSTVQLAQFQSSPVTENAAADVAMVQQVGFQQPPDSSQVPWGVQPRQSSECFPATIDSRGFSHLDCYRSRAVAYDEYPAESTPSLMPHGFRPWWIEDVNRQQRTNSSVVTLDVESLLIRAVSHSQFLTGLADLPLLREQSMLEAKAEFDTTAFAESQFARPSEPVGNSLTTGPDGPKRFREENWQFSMGATRKTRTGGRFELAQRFGLLNNNSQFLSPREQGNARLTLNFTQPLLNGAGEVYNSSLIMLANIDNRVAWDQVSTQMQDHLVDVIRAYWQLYLQRSVLQQKQRYLERGQIILAELEQRQEVDAVQNQIARARAAVASRHSELIRAKTSVRNVEARMRALVNDPSLNGPSVELLPVEGPHHERIELSNRDAMIQALASRSDIDEAIQEFRSASVRLSVSEKELLPVLDLMLETYVSGLQGDNDIGQSFLDQFSLGEPSYSVGLRFEAPLHNRAARARYQRRHIELRQILTQFRRKVEEVITDVEIAVREVSTSYDEMLSRYLAMVANETDLNYFEERWRIIPGEDRAASFLLQDILDAQDRAAVEELNFVEAQVNYAMALVEFKRTVGILLQAEQIDACRARNHCGERYRFSKPTQMPLTASSVPQPANPVRSGGNVSALAPPEPSGVTIWLAAPP